MNISQYISGIAHNFEKGISTPETEYFSLTASPEIIAQISDKLGLAFIREDSNERSGEVCYANTNDVRPEFRTVFYLKDVLNYLYAIIYSTKFHKDFDNHLKNNLEDIPITADAVVFWNLTSSGNELRKIHSRGKEFSDSNSAPEAIEKIIKEINSLLRDSNQTSS